MAVKALLVLAMAACATVAMAAEETCSRNRDCRSGYYSKGFCVRGKCAECKRAKHCAGSLKCMGGKCVECRRDRHCASTETCVDNKCEPMCYKDKHCLDGFICEDKVCKKAPECHKDIDCESGSICKAGACVADDTECRADSDCKYGYKCDRYVCVEDGQTCVWDGTETLIHKGSSKFVEVDLCPATTGTYVITVPTTKAYDGTSLENLDVSFHLNAAGHPFSDDDSGPCETPLLVAPLARGTKPELKISDPQNLASKIPVLYELVKMEIKDGETEQETVPLGGVTAFTYTASEDEDRDVVLEGDSTDEITVAVFVFDADGKQVDRSDTNQGTSGATGSYKFEDGETYTIVVFNDECNDDALASVDFEVAMSAAVEADPNAMPNPILAAPAALTITASKP